MSAPESPAPTDSPVLLDTDVLSALLFGGPDATWYDTAVAGGEMLLSAFSHSPAPRALAEDRFVYVDPPENVLVASIDEKTGIQAKSPTKPDTPPAAGRPARRGHEYKHNGTQCLFAALKVHHGDGLAMASKTRNRYDLIRFLDHLDAEIPIVEGQQIVAITDNLSTRGTQAVQVDLHRKGPRSMKARTSRMNH